jgi:hypothetical protein
MDKSKLHWAADADRAPEPAQHTAPDPPKRTAPVEIGSAIPVAGMDMADDSLLALAKRAAQSISLRGMTLLELKATLHHKGTLHYQVRR